MAAAQCAIDRVFGTLICQFSIIIEVELFVNILSMKAFHSRYASRHSR
jgi:hypothetical protein